MMAELEVEYPYKELENNDMEKGKEKGKKKEKGMM